MALSELFTAGAHRYDLLTRLNPGYRRHLRIAARLLACQHVPRRVLDLGCGTGASTRAILSQLGSTWVLGVDSSPGMIAQARQKPWPRGRVAFAIGAAGDSETTREHSPFDGCLAAYLLRNVAADDRTRVLTTIRRQLNDGGVLVIQDYTVAGSLWGRRVWDAVCWCVIIPLSAVTLRDTRLYRYLWRSVRGMEGTDAWRTRLREAGFDRIETYSGKGWQRGILHTVVARAGGAA